MLPLARGSASTSVHHFQIHSLLFSSIWSFSSSLTVYFLLLFAGCSQQASESVPIQDPTLEDVPDFSPKKLDSVITAYDLVFIENGVFEMGDLFNEGKDIEKPVHFVQIDSFYLGRHEVTFDEYESFCIATNREKPNDRGWGRGKHPVMNVSWYDAIHYCNWLNEKIGLPPVYDIASSEGEVVWTNNMGFRLPTEAEWEYAARQGGEKVRFGNGKDIASTDEINFCWREMFKRPYALPGVDRKQTIPVMSLNSPNSLGLHNMSGNVTEWCWDKFALVDYGQIQPTDTLVNPRGLVESPYRATRGGSYFSDPFSSRVAYRNGFRPNKGEPLVGFRLVFGPGK